MTKVKAKPSLTKAEVETILTELNDIDSDLTSFAISETNAIEEARKKFHEGAIEEERARHEKRKKVLVKKLEKFAGEDKTNWDGQSIKLSGGQLGFRWSPHSVALIKSISKNEDVALINLQTDYPQFVRRLPTINKDLILQRFMEKKLDKEKLNECGLKVEQKQKFYITTNFSDGLKEAQDKLKKA